MRPAPRPSLAPSSAEPRGVARSRVGLGAACGDAQAAPRLGEQGRSMTWQPNETSPERLDPRDVEGTPPEGSGSGEFIEGDEAQQGAALPPDHRGRLTEDAPGAERDAAVRLPSDPSTPLQTTPYEDGALDATDEQKIDGIVAQTRQDLEQGHGRSAHELLAQRFEQSQVPVSQERLGELARSLEQYEKR